MITPRRLLPIALAAAAVAAAGCGGDDDGGGSAAQTSSQSSAPASTGQGTTVSMRNIKFAPETIKVKVGETITWTNDESVPHDVVAESGADFKSEVFGKGGSFEFTPKKAGIIKYVCSLHPGMDGTIEVAD